MTVNFTGENPWSANQVAVEGPPNAEDKSNENLNACSNNLIQTTGDKQYDAMEFSVRTVGRLYTFEKG